MTKDHAFLSYFLEEAIYVVDSTEAPKQNTSQIDDQEVDTNQKSDEANEIVANLPPKLKFKGGNKTELLVVVAEENEEFIAAAETAFLTKILQAISMDIDDIALVNIANQPVDSLHHFGHINYSLMICFSSSLPPFLSSKERYILRSDSGKNILYCHSLQEIVLDRDKKVKLWEQLKLQFPTT